MLNFILIFFQLDNRELKGPYLIFGDLFFLRLAVPSFLVEDGKGNPEQRKNPVK